MVMFLPSSRADAVAVHIKIAKKNVKSKDNVLFMTNLQLVLMLFDVSRVAILICIYCASLKILKN